jgi:hypothetical protein
MPKVDVDRDDSVGRKALVIEVLRSTRAAVENFILCTHDGKDFQEIFK